MKPAILLALLLLLAIVALYTPDRPIAELQQRYPASYRMAAGVRLRIIDSGPRDAPAIILLHGFGSSLQTWDRWAARLQTDHRVIRYDLPGFGLTGPDPTGDYSDDRSIAVLAALMDTLRLQRATLIGNSMGGKLAWTFAATHPERVDRLVLISPDGFASPGFEYERSPKVPFLLRLLPYVFPRFLVRLSIAPAYTNPARLTPAVVTRYRDLMLAPGVRPAIIARLRQVMLHDPVPRLHRITAPTLILWGEQDAMIPYTNAADYQRAIPHATTVPLPDLGHVPFEEAPDASLPPVQAFLAAAPR